MNEEPTTNGIDVSEEIRYCNNCSNLGLDFKTGKFYCGLSNRNDELPEILSCENFSSNCYIKRLQEENKKLKNKNNDLIEEIASGNIDIAILQKENEKLKEKIKSEKYIKENALQEATKYSMKCGEFRQALEEIRSYCDEQNLKADYTACYITNRIDEVLNDRD